MNVSQSKHVDGRSTRWISHRVERRSALLGRAREILADTGPDVTMDELASAMGTSKSILYRYFEDRNGLREALAEEITAELRAAINALEGQSSQGAGVRLEDALGSYLAFVSAEPEVYLFISAGFGCEQYKPGVLTPMEETAGDVEGDDEAIVDAVLSSMPYECAALASLGESFIELPVLRRAAAVGALRCSTLRWVMDRCEFALNENNVGESAVSGGPEEDLEVLAQQLALWLRDGVLERDPA